VRCAESGDQLVRGVEAQVVEILLADAERGRRVPALTTKPGVAQLLANTGL